jgi:hypothetical protein
MRPHNGPSGRTRTGYRCLDKAPAATGHVRMPPALRLVMPAGTHGPRHGGQTNLDTFHARGLGYGGLAGDVVDPGRFAAIHLGGGFFHAMRPQRDFATVVMSEIEWQGTTSSPEGRP